MTRWISASRGFDCQMLASACWHFVCVHCRTGRRTWSWDSRKMHQRAILMNFTMTAGSIRVNLKVSGLWQTRQRLAFFSIIWLGPWPLLFTDGERQALKNYYLHRLVSVWQSYERMHFYYSFTRHVSFIQKMDKDKAHAWWSMLRYWWTTHICAPASCLMAQVLLNAVSY